MNGGKLIAQSADATNGSSYGIDSHGDIIINGGTVTATAGTASQESYGLGIFSVLGVEGKISLSSNAIVDASGVTAASNKKPEGYIDEIGTTFKHYAPTITDRANSSYVQGSQNTVYFHSSNTFTSFKKVLVDNKEISADCYTATEGSIVITFKPEYLNTLAVGTHSISIVSEEGTAITNFTVQQCQQHRHQVNRQQRKVNLQQHQHRLQHQRQAHRAVSRLYQPSLKVQAAAIRREVEIQFISVPAMHLQTSRKLW